MIWQATQKQKQLEKQKKLESKPLKKQHNEKKLKLQYITEQISEIQIYIFS